MKTREIIYLKIKTALLNSNIADISRYFYNLVFHKNRLMQVVHKGNTETKYLIIRPSSEDGIQGLMSLLLQAARWIEYAENNHYIPYIDFKNYKTQYYDGKNNVWEFFFKQPAININPYDNKIDTVVLSGVTRQSTIDFSTFKETIFSDAALLKRCSNIFDKYIAISDETKRIVDIECESLDIEECIGVYIRGTDYIKLKPSGEYVQPEISQVIDKTRYFINKYNCNVFLVTEDYDYYKRMKNEFGDSIHITSFDSFVKNYDGAEYLSKSGLLQDDPKQRGLNYLAKIVLLSRCKYLVSSVTCGSIAAYAFNGGKYEDEYIFKLGRYK